MSVIRRIRLPPVCINGRVGGVATLGVEWWTMTARLSSVVSGAEAGSGRQTSADC